MPITSEQCKAARMLAKIDRETLATVAGFDCDAVRRFEAGVTAADGRLVAALQHALQDLGVDFLSEENGHGVGVRLRFDRAGTWQISRWETEGGSPANDDVP